MSERASYFLKALIERYIRDGQPVGSRTLAKDTGLDLSPATVRNVMADLEDMGLVTSPHTSSGRVPTVSGYRLFVDSLLTVQPLAEQDINACQTELAAAADVTTLVDTASRLLSSITHLTGMVMVPRCERDVFHQIEFVPLSGTRLLVILVTGAGEVHNRIVYTDHTYTPAQLVQAGNMLTAMFSGQDLHTVRQQLLDDLEQTHQHVDQLMRQVLQLAQQVLVTAEPKDHLLVSGQTNLMEFDELANIERLKALFAAFTEKHQLLDLLDRCIAAEGVQIFIGDESGYALLDDCSLVTATYRVRGQVLGVLGVIGPTRMNYQRVIPVVDVTARLLAAAFGQQSSCSIV
ncbi:heat-inducible transcriptional repressor HrcA [Thiospirillum jenense]|uniref:Heat-inducible transcription repressor HrcA n=1 Tax=Thiospirillum jenense TaxID=1653858 RepID=A0A839HKG3_9GAMM|nr:heat-inducible transcriptional repressor HrcA [Thiospirillum jenense]MBB1126352.1 heat-inducible transcriptional repressor HrcA [Thiospirillum jenense]